MISIPDKAELIERDWAKGAAQIACVIDRDERAALHLCYTGKLPAFKLGGKWCMRPSAFFRHIARLEDAATAQLRAATESVIPAES